MVADAEAENADSILAGRYAKEEQQLYFIARQAYVVREEPLEDRSEHGETARSSARQRLQVFCRRQLS